MKALAWYFHEPGAVYALGPFRFEQPITEREARAYIRDWLKVRRLPKGCALWPPNK
jgi:hypothetical protein